MRLILYSNYQKCTGILEVKDDKSISLKDELDVLNAYNIFIKDKVREKSKCKY
ncbi:MAG: hypothetical protein WDM90_10905 [Ferruginibacter sp.]